MAESPAFDEPKAAQIRDERDRVLGSRTFSQSNRQSEFLAYVVEEALQGRSGKIKEFTIGIEVFGRDETYDPRVDSIVRVEASRLRAKLREYYAEEGAGDAVFIDIPKGHYAPAFRFAKASVEGESQPAESSARERRANTPRTRPRLLWVATAIGIIALAAGYGAYQILPSPPGSSELPIPPADAHTIAVLPLRDWSQEPEEYFSNAMTDAFITALARNRQLRVTSVTSVMAYRDVELRLPEVAKELGVGYIVEGSIFRDGDRVRITAQLIDASSDKHLWSRTYDRSMEDALLILQGVSAEIARELAGELTPQPVVNAPIVNPAAYEAYLKGRYFRNQLTADGLRKGIRYFQQAVELQPEYAEAYAGLASCHCLLGGHGLELVTPTTALPEAQALARKALTLNENLAEPNAFLGIIQFKYEWDPEGAEALLNRAIELQPSFFEAYLWQSQIMEATGRQEEAVVRALDARRLNPLSLAANMNVGWQLYQAGRFPEAEATFDSLIDFNPRFWGGHWGKGYLYRQREMYDRAIEEFRSAVELEGGHTLPLSALGYTYAVAGRREEALGIVMQLDEMSNGEYVSPFHVAVVYAGLNEPDHVFEWLEKAYRVRARSLAWIAATTELANVRGDSRYKDLVARIGISST